ncbi:hypothetical protein [Bradyrhizobium cajani]|uniref:Uncharacterized protein n=1 Tax=Bradyrhizobium cajani TaxID=1928661 RepID=A0A844T2C7_9BRAD|nr:hypothetical protein [Bradyrhizobium cajani]MCP3371184.1 hypothetical protein [Bradyrhizobium cajani]MVT72436.1 hypothetical protein [Bradyrhizobium cajani]
MRLLRAAALIAAWVATCTGAAAQEFQLEDVPAAASVPIAQIKPGTVIFADQRNDKLADPSTGLIPFDDWARSRPVQRRFLSLIEPTLNQQTKLKLSVYQAEARFRLPRPAAALDLSRYANIALLERIDPAVKHRPITAADAVPNKDAGAAHNRPPDRRWCEDAKVICAQSRYMFEGKIPQGIQLANKLREESKKPIPDFIEFQSEIMPVTQPHLAELPMLTGIDSTVTGALEQNIFWVNQVIQFGKLLAVLQQHPTEPEAAIATVYILVAVRNDVLNKQREYSNTPMLRNLVPAQLLMGKSSFNSGDSLSAGLPKYARSRVKAIADMMERE